MKVSELRRIQYCCHILLSGLPPHVPFFFLTLCDVVDYVTGVFVGHQRFSSTTSDQIEMRVEKGTIVLALSSRINWYATWPPSSIHELRGFDLTLTLESTFNLTSTKPKVYNLTRFDDRITMAREFWLCGYFWRSYSQNPNPDLWVIDLTCEVTS